MKIKENVFYVGVQDKNRRNFDIIMHTEYGTSYNSYVIKGTKKNAIIDAVNEEFTEEFLKNISAYIDIKDIHYLVVNHSEPDHTGAISKLLELNPNIEICGTKMAIDFIRNIINFDFKSNVLTANDSIDLGGKELKFFAFPMLRWPDSMYTYIKEDRLLFTCDSFGVHYSSDKIFNDEVGIENLSDSSVIKELYKYYFDNILGPFKDPFLLKALKKISLISIDAICPGHGLIIRSNVDKFIEEYRNWCTEENVYKKITVCYVSSYGFTKKIAKALIEGIKKYNIEVKEYDLQHDSIDEAIKDIKSSKGLLIGSPTILSDALPQIYAVMSGLNPLTNKGMTAMAFGSYAWSGEASNNINDRLKALRFEVIDPIRIKLNPSEHDLDQIIKSGEDFAKRVINN